VVLAACGSPSRPSVLLITIDTLRADALGVYGAEPSPSPQIDALAAEAAVFEHVISPMPMTRPAHFSMFTARYPREHGVLNNRLSLPEDAHTLAEELQAHGYRTGAFVAVAILSETSGASQGFEVMDAPRRRQRHAEGVVAPTLEWLGSLDPADPFFAWVHLFDPHQPYEQPDAVLGDVDAELLRAYPKLEWSDFYRVAEANGGDIPRAVLDHALALYRSEVAYADREVGRLLDGLRAVRDLDDVVVVVTADHGECFENGVYFEHADCLQQGALRVPLIVRHPESFEPGARIDTLASHVDLAPTLLQAVGVAAPESFGGMALQRPLDAARRVLVQYPFYQSRAVAGRLEKRKVIETVAGETATPVVVSEEKLGLVGRDWSYLRSGAREELYRLGARPDEWTNRAPEQPIVRADWSAELDAMMDRHPLNVLDAGEINEELRATLEALGYIQPPSGDSSPPSGGGR